MTRPAPPRVTGNQLRRGNGHRLAANPIDPTPLRYRELDDGSSSTRTSALAPARRLSIAITTSIAGLGCRMPIELAV